MGNRNSGRWGPRDGRPTTVTAIRYTIGRLSTWGRGMGYETLDDGVWLVGVTGGRPQVVRVVSVPHYPAGVRRFFLCDGCGARAAVLYGRQGWISCRRCQRLCYESQMLSRPYRRLRKMVRLGWL